MKRNSIIKMITLSITVSAFLTGCGTTTSTTSTNQDNNSDTTSPVQNSISLSGKAVDGYLQYATVCLDINSDGYCQENEPKTQTGEDGSFNLKIPFSTQNEAGFNKAMLLVYGGKDVDTGSDFRGKLLAPKDTQEINITPLTTLVAKAVQEELQTTTNLTEREIQEKITQIKTKVAKVLQLDPEDIDADPVALKDTKPQLIKEALKIQKSIEAIKPDADNDEIEKVYKTLALTLSKTNKQEGAEGLLEEAFKNNKEDLLKAKTVAANIDISFEKLDGDLTKVAHVIKEDIKKAKTGTLEKRGTDDALFNPNINWEEIYIKSELEDIGIKNPTKEDIESIKKTIGGEIRPGDIQKNAEILAQSNNETLKTIQQKVIQKEEESKRKEEIKKVQKDPEIAKIKPGTSLYNYYIDHDYDSIEINYSHVHIGDKAIDIKEYTLKNGIFVQDQNEAEYVLKNGQWNPRTIQNSLAYTIDTNGFLNLPQINLQVQVLNQKDISGQTYYIPFIDKSITMPKGAVVSMLQFNKLKDEYVLHEPVRDDGMNYTTISEYISKKCEQGYFTALDGSKCDSSTKTGHNKDKEATNSWKVATIDGIEILFEEHKYEGDTENNIYAVVEGKLYRGDFEPKGIQHKPEENFNQIAIEKIKEFLKAEYPVLQAKFEKEQETHKNDHITPKPPIPNQPSGNSEMAKSAFIGQFIYGEDGTSALAFPQEHEMIFILENGDKYKGSWRTTPDSIILETNDQNVLITIKFPTPIKTTLQELQKGEDLFYKIEKDGNIIEEGMIGVKYTAM